jgi:ribose transport system permease protein
LRPFDFSKDLVFPLSSLSARTIIMQIGLKRHWFDWINRQEFFVFILLLIAIFFLSLTTTTFLTANNLQNVSRNLAWIAIPAFGESLVILIGGIDLSVGAVMGLSGLVTALALRFGLSIPMAILAGLAAGSMIGWVNGTLVGRVRFPPFIVTLGTAAIVRGIIFGLAGGWPILDLPSGFRYLGQADISLGSFLFPLPVLVMLLLAALVFMLLRATILGRYIYTLGDSEQALIVTGVRLPQLKIIVYTLCGTLTAVGGILMTARLGVAAPTAATGYELDIIAAVIIGGTSLLGGQGSILGVLLGAIFMQVLRNGLVLLGIPAYWQSAALGSMIIFALLLDLWRQNRTSS